MKKEKMRCGKRCCNLSLPLEVDCLNKLGLEFMKGEEVADLFRQKRAMYEKIENALPEELKSVLLSYDDTINHISSEGQKFFFKNGISWLMRFVRLIIGGKSNIKLDIHVV